ncbi:hypothetical protein EDC04DRAFT_171382 [Pisolithus marmoratus]|nr:hypothetical protein EDC04DRAFT_171382 [Pisolithus marmoratus]
MACDPLVRTAALVSVTCELTSLSYRCVCIVRSGTMNSMHRATTWAQEAQGPTTPILWNVWATLAWCVSCSVLPSPPCPPRTQVHDLRYHLYPCLRMVLRIHNRSIPSPLSPNVTISPYRYSYFGASMKTFQGYVKVNGTRDEQRWRGELGMP